MTLSRQLLAPGRLILSPAVEPSESADSGIPPYGETAITKPGTKVQRSDVRTGIFDLNPGDPFDLVFDGPGPGYKWKIERASIGSARTGAWTKCEVHAGPINEQNRYETLVDQSAVPNSDIADESSPIYVGDGQPLTFRFYGGNSGEDATARIQYVEEALGYGNI